MVCSDIFHGPLTILRYIQVQFKKVGLYGAGAFELPWSCFYLFVYAFVT